MTTRDLLRKILIAPSLAPAARVNGTASGTGVDLRGYDAAVLAVAFGTWTDGTHTPTAQQSVDGITYTACGTADLDGTFAPVSGTGGANAVQQVGYVGSQRFVKLVMTTSGATSGAVSQASVIAGSPRNAPTQ